MNMLNTMLNWWKPQVHTDQFVPLYKSKPPFVKFKNGHGYLGVVLYDPAKDLVQCHLCGKWFKSLNGHFKTHKITAQAYKDKMGLYRNTSLVALGTIRKFSDSAKKRMKRIGRPKVKANYTVKKSVHHQQTLQHKNKFGTCDAQLKQRLFEEFSKNGDYQISMRNTALYGAIKRRFGKNPIPQALKRYKLQGMYKSI